MKIFCKYIYNSILDNDMRFTETIDGSIRNIIQLKTVDNSLEWSQMFDAL